MDSQQSGELRRNTTWGEWLLRDSPLRRVLLLILDSLIAAVALWGAFNLRFEGAPRPPYDQVVGTLIALLLVSRVGANILLRLHRWSFRLSGLADAPRVVTAAMLGTGGFLTLVYFFGVELGLPAGPPRSVVVLEFFITTSLMGLIRFSPRLTRLYVSDHLRSLHEEILRTLIVGAGAAGESLLRDLRRSTSHPYSVIGFIDDDSSKQGSIVGGKPVLGSVSDLRWLVKRHKIGAVLIAIARVEPARIRQILALCADLKVRFKTLPVSFTFVNDRAARSMLQDLSPEDLLRRAPVEFSQRGAWGSIADRTVLVTGAAGTIGGEICRQLLGAGVGQVTLLDIDENNLYLMMRRFERVFPRVSFRVELADVRDPIRIQRLVEELRPDDVFHAAAHKHVPLMEAAPCEAVKNNVLGTWNVARAAINVGAERFVLISSDKAVEPSSVMGATKAIGEVLISFLARRSRTRLSAVRFGNVLGSAGSVVPVFREQIADGKPVTVTHPEVERYFMTLSEAVGLVLKAAYNDLGTLCVLDMGEQIKIADLAKHMITMAGLVPDVDVPLVFTGLRPGEKLSEKLLTTEEERKARLVDGIWVAEIAAPRLDLEEVLQEIGDAASREDEARVRQLMRLLVPSYGVTSGAVGGSLEVIA